MAPPGPLELRRREQTVADKFHGFVINIIIRGLHQFGEHVNDKKFYFVRVQKAEQDWTDKGDHSGSGYCVSAAELATKSPSEFSTFAGASSKVFKASTLAQALTSPSRDTCAARTALR